MFLFKNHVVRHLTVIYDWFAWRVFLSCHNNIIFKYIIVWDWDQDNKCLNNWATSTSYYNLFNAYIL